MLRIGLAAVAVVFAVSVANAEALKLTDTQMDTVANAEALKLTDTQMDTVRAGAGLDVKNPKAPVPMGGIPPWSALFKNFDEAAQVNAGPSSGIILLLPRSRRVGQVP